MTFTLVAMTAGAVERIVEWHYPPPYDFYDLTADPDDFATFVDPTNWEQLYAVEDETGTLVGFFQFESGDRSVEVGLGMHPERTGRGDGQAFVAAGLAFARGRYAPEWFDLAVATFNDRAIAVYESLGFEPVETVTRATNGGEYEFLRMRLVE